MVETADIKRPDPALVSKLAEIGSATVSSELAKLGIRSAHILGPVARTPGIHIAGPALTLQCMPKREDVFVFDEYSDPEEQLHRRVMYHTQPGDVIVVDARGDMSSGIFGEMMMTYFKAQGGVGVVVDGCIRDFGQAKNLGVGLWLRGTTPNFHAQTDIFPYAVNVPVACGGTLVLPGDIIVADDDGATVVPVSLAEPLIAAASEHIEWEAFSRQRLAEGGDLRTYYPLSEEGRRMFEQWRRERIGSDSAEGEAGR
jgi:regulator of RNase E activity RraA